jgi:hypothetical protein
MREQLSRRFVRYVTTRKHEEPFSPSPDSPPLLSLGGGGGTGGEGAGGAENNLWRSIGADSRTLSVCGLTPIAYPTSAGVATRFVRVCDCYSFPLTSRTWDKGAGNRGAERANLAASAFRV